MTRKLRGAVGSSGEVEASAEEVLRKGNAVDAVVAGAFAACAVSPGVLLGPVQILVGGGGSGLRAVDGRVRQPGIGAPRPRGFRDEEEVPDASRVGVPWLPAALAVAVATAGTSTLAQVLAPALALAKGSARFDLLARLASRGPRMLEERPLATELLHAAGRPSGGLLTPEDLSSPRPVILAASRSPIVHGSRGRARHAPGSSGRATREGVRARAARDPGDAAEESRFAIELPWSNQRDGVPSPPASPVAVAGARACLAVDRNGGFAVACWDEGFDGIMLPDLEIRAPFFAEPVRRGQTRVKPGDPRAAAAPLAMVGTTAGPEVAFAACGAGDAYDVLAEAIHAYTESGMLEAQGDARLVAIARAGDGAVSALR